MTEARTKTWEGNNYSNRFGSYKLQCEPLTHTKGITVIISQHHNLVESIYWLKCMEVYVPSPLDGVGAKGEGGGGV